MIYELKCTQCGIIGELEEYIEEFDCPQCGEESDQLFEGYCLDCLYQNQSELDNHNAQFDRWESLTDSQRQNEINKARQ